MQEGGLVSGFGDARRGHRHGGIDIRGRRGQPVLAAGPGRVVFSGSKGNGYGLMVVIDHGGGIRTLYAHGSEVLVEEGDRVAQGQAIAVIGRTGNATSEHCHFELRRDGAPVDPLPHLLGLEGVGP